jgi:hypothetical protein
LGFGGELVVLVVWNDKCTKGLIVVYCGLLYCLGEFLVLVFVEYGILSNSVKDCVGLVRNF